MRSKFKYINLTIFSLFWIFAHAIAEKKSLFKEIPFPTTAQFIAELSDSFPELAKIKNLSPGVVEIAIAHYFKEKSAERFYFNWKNFNERLHEYFCEFPQKKAEHVKLAHEHIEKFAANTRWHLPMKDLAGNTVSAYEFRHLARQSKIPDVALTYYIKNQDPKYLDYFITQVRSLNTAFTREAVEIGGNAVYEVFRAGKRIHHWLFNHHAFLASKKYQPKDQLLLIRTFLHHGQILFRETQKFKYGNHQTRGLVALFEIATLFPEFKSAARWRKHALEGLLWHMEHEINADGFQFERSGHYHKGDIENYLKVYQLAQINQIELPETFTNKFKAMFTVLTKLAMPNGQIPVLQDDTDEGSETEADISEPMAVGAMIFSEPVFRYFAGETLPANFYWLLTAAQLNKFKDMPRQKPEFGSLALEQTGYYVMRDGWQKNSRYMIISAGMEKRKPDHQHGDVLGIIAYSKGSVILPNYKVKYNRPNFPFLKNSWAKNVALVDSQLQGREWNPNRGGSGFGKWKILPEAQVKCWSDDEQVSYFRGEHNGFENLGVTYEREVLFVKKGFWLIRDIFESNAEHLYQQVWQGHWKQVNNSHIVQSLGKNRSINLIQLGDISPEILQSFFGQHQNNVFQTRVTGNFKYTTLIIPDNIQQSADQTIKFADFEIQNKGEFSLASSLKIRLETIVKKSYHPILMLGVRELEYRGRVVNFPQPVHLYVLNTASDEVSLKILGKEIEKVNFQNLFPNVQLNCGSILKFKI